MQQAPRLITGRGGGEGGGGVGAREGEGWGVREGSEGVRGGGS